MRKSIVGLAVSAALLLGAATSGPAWAISSVAIVGSLQSELGCTSDWQPDCTASRLVLGSDDGVYTRQLAIPAGSYEYKATYDGVWDVNYGAHAMQDGGNIALPMPSGGPVTFLYDPVSHWVTDSRTAVIATAPGSFQSELGCPSDWAPDCLRSWLQDVDGDGIYSFHTTALPAGDYEAKVALNQSWDVNYGAGGAVSGGNIAFTVTPGEDVVFTYNSMTHVMVVGPPATPPSGEGGGGSGGTTTSTPAPTTTPPPVAFPAPVATVDKTAPRLAVKLGRQTVADAARHGIAVTLSATEAGRVAWRLVLAGNVTAGRGTVAVTASGKRVRLKLSRSGRQRLARSSHPRLTLATTTTDRAGNVTRAKRQVSLRRG